MKLMNNKKVVNLKGKNKHRVIKTYAEISRIINKVLEKNKKA